MLRHGAFAVMQVRGIALDMGRITVASQVGHQQAIPATQVLRDTLPHDMGLRKTVEQHQHRQVRLRSPIGRLPKADWPTDHRARLPLEALKPGHQSTLAPEALTTSAHFLCSASISAANCAGVLPLGIAPKVAKRSFMAGVANDLATSC